MDISLSDKSKRSLLEVHISFHAELLREFFFSRGGVWRYCYLSLSSLFFLSFFCGLHSIWPHYFEEIPLYPAVIFFAFLSIRFGLLPALLLAIPGGIMLDAAFFQTPGTHVLMLVVTAFAASLISERFPLPKTPIAAIVFSCALATSAFVLMQLLFFAGGLAPAARLALLPKYFLLALLVNALAAGPVLFASLGFLERIFSRPKDV